VKHHILMGGIEREVERGYVFNTLLTHRVVSLAKVTLQAIGPDADLLVVQEAHPRSYCSIPRSGRRRRGIRKHPVRVRRGAELRRRRLGMSESRKEQEQQQDCGWFHNRAEFRTGFWFRH